MKNYLYYVRSYKNDLVRLLRIAGLSFILLFAATGTGFSNTYSEITQISLNIKRQTIKDVFSAIENKSEYVFLYSDDVIGELSRTVDVYADSETLDTILDNVFTGTNLNYKISDRQVSVTRTPVPPVPVQRVEQQQTRVLTGVVRDTKSNPVIGANVIIKGTLTGVSTDASGRFTINVPVNGTLEVSSLGYITREVNTGTQSRVDVVLEETAQEVDEIIVVGYGTQKKVNLTGSVATVSTKDITDRVQTNVLSAIQGTVPGVTVISRPGQTPSINFRGRGNLGTSAPLYVIDGAVADETFFSNLDPNSIESISFLKDAASSAIYGSRAAYGVVLVTTKAGTKERMSVSYNGYVGIKSLTYTPDLVNSWEYAEFMNEGMYNRNPAGGKNQAYTADQIGWFRDGSRPDYYPNTDWLDLVLDKHVVTTQHSVNFSGGSEKVRFFTGLGYLYDDKYMPGQNSDRYNLDINLSADMNKWLTLKGGVKYIRNTSDTKHGVPWTGNFILVPPTMVARQSNGEWGSIAGGQQATQSFLRDNPLRTLSKNNWSESKSDNILIDMGFDIKPLPGLTISGQGFYKGYESKSKSYTGLQDNVKTFETGEEIPGTGIYTNEMSMNWQSTKRKLFTTMVRYEWSNHSHYVNAMAGTSYEKYDFERLYSKRKDFAVDSMKDIETGATVSKDLPNGTGISENKMLSYFARVNYSYLDKYLFEANLRADASSRFHKDNRWGVFPSFSAGWRINQEEFMSSVNWVTNLKLRASWGMLGNINNVGNYDYFQNYNSNGNYNFDNTAVIGVIESKPANKNLGWEKVSLTDIGIDFDLFNNKLSVVADYYVKRTSDILLGYNVPRETGISSNPSQNIGKVRNRGFEMAVTHRNRVRDFSYSVSVNIATNSNKITNLGSSDDIIQNGGDKIRYILREGESVGAFYGYSTNGLYTQEEIDNGHYYTFGRTPKAGDIKYVPQRENVAWGSGITGDDRVIIGKDVPDFTYGLNINMSYKNFEFGLFGQGVSGTKVAFESEQVWCLFLNSSPRKYHRKRWTEENPNPKAIYPRIYGGHSFDDYNQNFSDFQLFSADYFRIKTISLGYNLPQAAVSKIGLSAMKVFFTGENLFTIRGDKKMKDFDPESASGRGLGAYGTKAVAFGINITF